jgi:hypothetical protein
MRRQVIDGSESSEACWCNIHHERGQRGVRPSADGSSDVFSLCMSCEGVLAY